MDKVSSVQELNTILDKYQNLIDIPSSDINTSSGPGIDKTIVASNSGSTNVYYSINPQYTLNPQQIIKENYSVLNA